MARLAPLPIQALRLESAAAAQIARLGLITIGRLAGTPRDQITRRFGAGVVRRLDQALGRAEEALVFRRPPNPWFARLAFAEPISTPDDLARVAADITGALCARLEAEGRGARRFELCFHRLDGLAQRLAIGLSLPGREAARIARLFVPQLETIDPGLRHRGRHPGRRRGGAARRAPAAPGRPGARSRRRTAWRPWSTASPAAWAPTAVWRAEPFPSHAPERAVVRRPPLSRRAGRRLGPRASAPPAPVPPPRADRGHGPDPRRPAGLLPLARRAAPRPPRRGPRAPGPRMVALRPTRPPRRDYYRVEDDAGARFWLFRAGLYGADAPPKWWLHGLFG